MEEERDKQEKMYQKSNEDYKNLKKWNQAFILKGNFNFSSFTVCFHFSGEKYL